MHCESLQSLKFRSMIFFIVNQLSFEKNCLHIFIIWRMFLIDFCSRIWERKDSKISNIRSLFWKFSGFFLFQYLKQNSNDTIFFKWKKTNPFLILVYICQWLNHSKNWNFSTLFSEKQRLPIIIFQSISERLDRHHFETTPTDS